MPYNSKKLKFIREKVKRVKQTEMAKHLGLERGTYAARESKGDFTPEEFGAILKKLKVSQEYYDTFQIPGETQSEYSSPESIIRIEAYMKIALSVMAELLAKQNGASVTGTLNTLTAAVKAEYDLKIAELSKSGAK
jgi:DNA-binding XRE family transcriptional regulator